MRATEYELEYEVYISDGIIYSCILNQTDVGDRNANKFYIIELLQKKSDKTTYLYIRYGRIGVHGTASLKPGSVRDFEKAFSSKTKNKWVDRDNFVYHDGYYYYTKTDDTTQPQSQPQQPPQNDIMIVIKPEDIKTEVETVLEPHLYNLISFITNTDMFNQTMKDLMININEMPLGKISKSQIQNAYNTLKEIADIIATSVGINKEIKLLSNKFYTLFPMSNGRSKLPIISTPQIINTYVEALRIIGDIEIAFSISTASGNRIDRVYQKIGAQICYGVSDEEYAMITRYMTNTVCPTHNSYKLELLEVYSIYRAEEHKRFIDYGNKMLLFHGSRVANIAGILSTGLKINSGAIKTGAMFGNGLYFANACTKSANYCAVYPSKTNSNSSIGIILLCEVSLGQTYDLTHSNYVVDIPNELHKSTRGMGKSTPDPNAFTTVGDVCVPYGPLIPRNIESSLLYDEFIVYSEKQVKIRYLLKVRFNSN